MLEAINKNVSVSVDSKNTRSGTPAAEREQMLAGKKKPRFPSSNNDFTELMCLSTQIVIDIAIVSIGCFRIPSDVGICYNGVVSWFPL